MQKLWIVLIFLPAIVASFLSYELVLDELTIQYYINEQLPATSTTGIVPYSLDSLEVDVEPNALIVNGMATTLIRDEVVVDFTARSKISYMNSKFYLSNLDIISVTHEWKSEHDKSLVEGGIALGKAFLRDKINSIENAKLRDAVSDELAKQTKLESTLENLYIPVYDVNRGPWVVEVLGAVMLDLKLQENQIVIKYSPRIFWLWLLSFIVAFGVVMGIATGGMGWRS